MRQYAPSDRARAVLSGQTAGLRAALPPCREFEEIHPARGTGRRPFGAGAEKGLSGPTSLAKSNGSRYGCEFSGGNAWWTPFRDS